MVKVFSDLQDTWLSFTPVMQDESDSEMASFLEGDYFITMRITISCVN